MRMMALRVWYRPLLMPEAMGLISTPQAPGGACTTDILSQLKKTPRKLLLPGAVLLPGRAAALQDACGHL